MQVQPINTYNPNFNRIKIKTSEQYKALRRFCQENNYKTFLQQLNNECKKLENTNMDLTIHEGKNYPQFLKEIQDKIEISDIQLYNETLEKIFGCSKYDADIIIFPSDYKLEKTKQPVRYAVNKLHIAGNYIADKWINKLKYRTYPKSHDPKYMFHYSYFDIPLPEMILDIKKKIFNSILESNVQLANNTKHL